VSAAANFDHFYLFGDVYETVDACDQLELLLGRLRRQRLLNEGEWLQLRDHVAKIRAHLESRLTQPA
jgi:hypothetical protein